MKAAINIIGFFAILCSVAAAPPAGVEGFQVERYLGKWYEIARLDHSFERGLSQVTARYGLRPDGTLSVVNRGYDARNGRWREARGVARFTGSPTVGSLKVSFFRPFWGGYHVIALDKERYRYALVAGPNRRYLWILSRTPRLERPTLEKLLAQARAAGFDTRKLIFPEQTPTGSG